MEGLPHWEKRILRDFGLFRVRKCSLDLLKLHVFISLQGDAIAIVKNIPEINAMLWKVKHLIKIEAVQFPYGEPTTEDIDHTYLRENGDCLVIKEIGKDHAKRLEAAINFYKDPKKLSESTLQRDSRLKWVDGWM